MQLDYETVGATLTQIGADMDAAECHGVLCGLLCTDKEKAASVWLNHIMEQLGPTTSIQPDSAAMMLNPLVSETQKQLTDVEFSFQPVIPGDDDSIANRTRALGQWAQGFLVGMSFGGVRDLKELPGDAKEIMLDISKIAQAGRYAVSGTEEDESAFTEILEYLRAGVMLVYQELNASGPTPPVGGSIH